MTQLLRSKRSAEVRHLCANLPRLLTVNEAATHLRLSRSKVYELIATRSLVAFKPGGRLRIPASAIEAYLDDTRI